MKCLGPPESKWNQQVFEVTQGGCIGGRRVPTSTGALSSKDRDRESVLFDDSTVSRIHFEVAHDSVGQHYTIRDLVRPRLNILVLDRVYMYMYGPCPSPRFTLAAHITSVDSLT